MSRLISRTWIVVGCLFALAGLAGVFLVGRSEAQQVVTGNGSTVPTLKEQLNTGLLARTPSERAFVDRVVAKVNAGVLPRRLVDSTFLWARNQQPYPMPYFERALKLRAKRLGIDF